MKIIEMRADELMPGDKFDTRRGINDYGSFVEVTGLRLIEHPAPEKDRIEIRWADDSMSPSRVLLEDSVVRVLLG